MVPVSNITACYVTFFISFLLPLFGGVLFLSLHRKEKLTFAWLLGALGFFVPQMVVRTPLLQLLSPHLAPFPRPTPWSMGWCWPLLLPFSSWVED